MEEVVTSFEAVLYLEKIDVHHQVPVSSITVGGAVGSPATCTVVVPPVNNVLELKPRTIGYVFYRDKKSTAPGYHGQLKLAFIGEYLSMSCQFTRTSRSVALTFADAYHFLSSVYLYQRSWDVNSSEFLSDLSVLEGSVNQADIINRNQDGKKLIHKMGATEINGILHLDVEKVKQWTKESGDDHVLNCTPPLAVDFLENKLGVQWWVNNNDFLWKEFENGAKRENFGMGGKVVDKRYGLANLIQLYKGPPPAPVFKIKEGTIKLVTNKVLSNSNWVGLNSGLNTAVTPDYLLTNQPKVLINESDIKATPNHYIFVNEKVSDPALGSLLSVTMNNIDLLAEVSKVLEDSSNIAKQLDPDTNKKIETLFASIIRKDRQCLNGTIILSLEFPDCPEKEMVIAATRLTDLLAITRDQVAEFVSRGIERYISMKNVFVSALPVAGGKEGFFGDSKITEKVIKSDEFKSLNLRIVGITLADISTSGLGYTTGIGLCASPDIITTTQIDQSKGANQTDAFKTLQGNAKKAKYFDSFRWGIGADIVFFTSGFDKPDTYLGGKLDSSALTDFDEAVPTSASSGPPGMGDKKQGMMDLIAKIISPPPPDVALFEVIEGDNAYKNYNSGFPQTPLRKFTISVQEPTPEVYIKGHQVDTCLGSYYKEFDNAMNTDSLVDWVKPFESGMPGAVGDTILNALASAFEADNAKNGDMGTVMINFIGGLCREEKVNPYIKYMLFRNRTLECIGSTVNDTYSAQFYKKDYIKDVWLQQVNSTLGLITTISEVLSYLFNKIYYAYSPFLFPPMVTMSTSPDAVKKRDLTDEESAAAEKKKTEEQDKKDKEEEKKKSEEAKRAGTKPEEVKAEPEKVEVPEAPDVKLEAIEGTEIIGTHIPTMTFNPLTYFFNAPECNIIKQEEYVSFNFTRQPLTEITRLGSSIVNWAASLGNSSVPIPRAAIQQVIVSPTIIFHKDPESSSIGDMPQIKQTQATQQHEKFTGIVPDWRNLDDFMTRITAETINQASTESIEDDGYLEKGPGDGSLWVPEGTVDWAKKIMEAKSNRAFTNSLDALYPPFKDRLVKFLKKAKADGFPFKITQTLRAVRYQRWLWEDSGHASKYQVASPKPESAPHLLGVGADMMPDVPKGTSQKVIDGFVFYKKKAELLAGLEPFTQKAIGSSSYAHKKYMKDWGHIEIAKGDRPEPYMGHRSWWRKDPKWGFIWYPQIYE